MRSNLVDRDAARVEDSVSARFLSSLGEGKGEILTLTDETSGRRCETSKFLG